MKGAAEATPDPVGAAAKRLLGVDYLYPVQRFVVSNVLEGHGQIVVLPTVRGPDGLALSSRNAYLSSAERAAAAALPAALRWAEEEFARGGRRAAGLIEGMCRILAAPAPAHIAIDYVEVRAAEDLATLETIDRPAVVALAARIGRTRLIDNTLLTP